jgi:hypothetical protein
MTSPVFKDGMTVTVRRGKRKGETATVESINGDQVVVKHADGSISIQNAPSLKAPEVPTIDADTLADALGRFQKANSEVEEFALKKLADFLGDVLPGFSRDSVNWTYSVEVQA